MASTGQDGYATTAEVRADVFATMETMTGSLRSFFDGLASALEKAIQAFYPFVVIAQQEQADIYRWEDEGGASWAEPIYASSSLPEHWRL